MRSRDLCDRAICAIGRFMRSGDLCDRAIDKIAVGKRHGAVSSMPSPHKIYLAGPICSETARRRVLNALSLPAFKIP
jgi:hypothetical protein